MTKTVKSVLTDLVTLVLVIAWLGIALIGGTLLVAAFLGFILGAPL